MKRYLVFGGLHYYPGGGGEDFRNDFDELEEAKLYATEFEVGREIMYWAHVWDSETKTLIWIR